MSAESAPGVLDQFRLDGRVALVTGASAGLGARFARVLAAAGADLVLTARRTERVEALAAELGGLAVPADLTVPGTPDQLVAAALDRFGRLDVLVNNAGVGDPGQPAEDEPLDLFRSVVDTNLVALFALTQAAARPMLDAGRGSIVNLSSVLGLVASHPISQAGYTSTKAAVVNLTRELAVQWARKGVRVNALAPGWFPSEMTEEMFADERSMQFLRRNAPAGRPGEEHELDGALLFLASDASTYVTGAVLTVDGGWTAR